MRGAFLAEWIVLGRRRFLLATVAAVIGVSALGTTLTLLAVGHRDVGGNLISKAALERPAGLVQGAVAVGGLVGVVALAVVAAAVAGEYSHGTLRTMLIAQPRRLTLLAGKYLALVTFIVGLALVAVVACAGLSLLIAPAKDIDISAWTGWAGMAALGKAFVNMVVSSIGYGTMGLLFAVVLRSPAASISVGLAYALPVEGLMSRVWSPSARWLPGQLLDTLATGGVNDAVSYLVAAQRLVPYAVAAVAVIVILVRRRDVTA